MRLRLTYLLILGLFFLKGYTAILALAPAGSCYHSQYDNLQNNRQKIFDSPASAVDFLQPALFSDDNDDDETTTARKKIAVSRSFDALINTLYLVYFHASPLKNNLKFYQGFCYLSSARYIFQGVLKV